MSAGKIRENEEDKIPLDTPVWGFTVSMKNRKSEEQVFHFSKSGNSFILEELKAIKKPFSLYIVWHGNWNTDVFKCDPAKIINRLKEETSLPDKEA